MLSKQEKCRLVASCPRTRRLHRIEPCFQGGRYCACSAVVWLVHSSHAWAPPAPHPKTRAKALGRVACPALATVGTGEGNEARRQFDPFCSYVAGPVTRRVFEVTEGADMHCQVGNLPLCNAVVYDWLEETL